MNQQNLPDFNLDFGNFDPMDIASDETINAVLIVDVSPSVASYVQELNDAFKDFLKEMQQSHVAEKLMVSVIEFNESIMVRNGFQPINSLNSQTIEFKPCGGGTALYDAVLSGLTNAVNYRTNLENSGVNCKTFIFAITDGEDNSSKNTALKVKNLIDQLIQKEQNAYSFETVLFGVGNDSGFEQARNAMGIQHLARIGNTGKEIRKMIGFISASLSKISTASIQLSF